MLQALFSIDQCSFSTDSFCPILKFRPLKLKAPRGPVESNLAENSLK
jgi:hypothetical protein